MYSVNTMWFGLIALYSSLQNPHAFFNKAKESAECHQTFASQVWQQDCVLCSSGLAFSLYSCKQQMNRVINVWECPACLVSQPVINSKPFLEEV